ncbi:MAG: hypothetical protein ISP86_01545 [Shewanellaceae bacterium]|nr:hypothetical protein [Shewanellaceae bacterium]
MILYTLNQPNLNTLKRCIELMRKNDTLLLVADAVTLSLQPNVQVLLQAVQHAYLKDDLLARGLTHPEAERQCTYEQWVQWTIEADQTFRWR